MKPMTAAQLTAICRVFTDGNSVPSTEQVQKLLNSGCLADLRDANYGFVSATDFRNRIREACGLPPINANGQVECIVNGNRPFVPEGWQVESHQEMGNVRLFRSGDDLLLGGKKIDFFLSPNQGEGKSIKGDKLRKELEGKSVLNANVLDYLLKFPDLIPESWKTKEKDRARYIFFWGTIYSYSGGDLIVRCLCWHDGQWNWSGSGLGNRWNVGDPAAVLAR